MRIAIVCLNLSWQSGGPRLIFSMAQELKKGGHEVVIYAPEFSGKYFKDLWRGLDIRVVPAGATIEWLGRPKNIFSWVLRKLRQESASLRSAEAIADAMRDDFDTINVHDFAYSVAYFYKKKNPKAKTIWTENDPPFMYLPKKNPVFDILSRAYNSWKAVSMRKYFRAIDRVSVLDLYNKEWCEKMGLSAAVVRLGVDFKNFYLPVKDVSERAKKKEMRIFALGALNQYRRYEDIILAVKVLRDWGYNVTAKFIANDMWGEKAQYEKLIGVIKDNKLEDRVDFHLGGVPDEELRDAYRNSDVFVYAVYLPPPRNGFGFSIGVFEAMAAGLPLIVCRTTTSTEVLKDGETALFIDPMSPEQIAEKVKSLIDNPDKYKAIAAAGQKLVKENLTWENYTKGVLELIRK